MYLIFLLLILIPASLIAEDESKDSLKSSIKIFNLGAVVNSEGLDYAPSVSPDGRTLFFVSDREGSLKDISGQPSHDFWIARKNNKLSLEFKSPANADKTNILNTINNEGVLTIASDGKTVFFTACSRNDGLGSCDIYSSKLIDGEWQEPENLGSNVNSFYWESMPSISPDMKRIYFISNRPYKGKDQKEDIWYCDWDPDMEEWGEAFNLETINTSDRESSVFIGADNLSLFFSSNGRDNNVGGMDFYVSRFDRTFKAWTPPALLSQPINSKEDDEFLTLSASGDVMYFASKRDDIIQENVGGDEKHSNQGSYDIFMALLPKQFGGAVVKIFVADMITGKNLPSKITIKNPVTGDVRNSSLTKIDSLYQIVVSNTDFGDIQDSVEYIDIEIKDEVQDSIETTKTLRVLNPELLSPGHQEIADELDVTLEADVFDYVELSSLSDEIEEEEKIERSVLSGSIKAYGISSSSELEDLETIYIEEFESTNMRPLLNYIFFYENTANLDSRYKQGAKNKFDISSLKNKDALQTYYYILPIIGSRMKDNPESSIKLIGTLDGKQETDINLAKSRAEKIKDYLVSVWGISSERIEIDAQAKPEKASNSKTQDGREENRRVEIIDNSGKILKPILTNDTLLTVVPNNLRFEQEVYIKNANASWKLDAYSGTNPRTQTLLKSFSGTNPVMQSLDWEIYKDAYDFNPADDVFKYEMLLTDLDTRKIIVYKDEIPIERVSLEQKRKELEIDKRIDKFSLILFDFNQSNLSEENIEIIDLVKKYLKGNSKALIEGYSDRVGNEIYNLRLSKQRADEANKLLGFKNSRVKAVGENVLLYDNNTPEGRFYCRTVLITIETPLEEL